MLVEPWTTYLRQPNLSTSKWLLCAKLEIAATTYSKCASNSGFNLNIGLMSVLFFNA